MVNKKGFTLIELLVVIAILAVLATAVVLVLNPAELVKQSRDATRIADAVAVQRVFAMIQADGSISSFGSSSVVYTSLPDISPTCANLGLPTPPTGFSWNCVSSSSLRKTDGTGWIPANLNSFSAGSPLSKLPIDPENSTTSGKYYTFVSDGSVSQWTINVPLISQKYTSSTGAKDGGFSSLRFETGTDLSLASSVVVVVSGENVNVSVSVCGNGITEPGEICDDANGIDDDECTNNCTVLSCGDTETQEPEQCDDGNGVNTDECTNRCSVPVCGDSYVQEPEACDDGNTIDTDECTNSCTLPS
jgi:prepilin-type N-terminal cleavage/methylation domain-containing protein